MRRSLTVRIILLSIIWITLALVVTVILLRMMYRDHIELHYDAHVFTHLEELVAATEVGTDGEFHLQRQPTDPNFHRPGSGWYWEVNLLRILSNLVDQPTLELVVQKGLNNIGLAAPLPFFQVKYGIELVYHT